MTVYLYPADAVAGAPSYTAETWRLLANGVIGGKTASRPLGGRTGVWPGTPSTTVSVSGSTITVAAHGGVLDLETPADAGPYNYAVDPAETRALTASSATDQRVDSIFVRLDDPAEGDGTSVPAATVNYVTGTVGPAGGARGAAGGPPNVPARSFELAQILVPKTGTGSPSVTWVAPYAVAAGGIIPCKDSTQYPSGAYDGMAIYDQALDQLMVWNGATWSTLTMGAWTSYTPVLKRVDTGTVVACTDNGSRYMLIGKTVHVQGDITASGGCSNAGVSLPFTAKNRLTNCGTLVVMGAGTLPSDQSCVANMYSDKAQLVLTAFTTGFRDVLSGQSIRWNATYELP